MRAPALPTERAMLATRTVVSLAAIALALLVAGAGLAGERQPIRLNAADQAAARAVVLRRGDLGSAAGWTWTSRNPVQAALSCRNFRPKQSDLVVTGAAASQSRHRTGVVIDSEAAVLRTARMVQLDWRRTVEDPRLLSCLRSHVAKGMPRGARLVSFRRMPFAHLAPYAAAYRLVMDVRASRRRVRMLMDTVLVGRSRTEITLTLGAPYASRSAVAAAETRLARILLSRVRA